MATWLSSSEVVPVNDGEPAGDESGTTGRETASSDLSEGDTVKGSKTDGGGRLATLRQDARRRLFVTVAGVAVGLAVAFVHWIGFVVGGALVALAQRTMPRGVAAGVGFGVLAWLVFLATLGSASAVDTYLQMGKIFVVSSAIPIGGGLLGSLIRGIQ